jgi:hypothetical protein
MIIDEHPLMAGIDFQEIKTKLDESIKIMDPRPGSLSGDNDYVYPVRLRNRSVGLLADLFNILANEGISLVSVDLNPKEKDGGIGYLFGNLTLQMPSRFNRPKQKLAEIFRTVYSPK